MKEIFDYLKNGYARASNSANTRAENPFKPTCKRERPANQRQRKTSPQGNPRKPPPKGRLNRENNNKNKVNNFQLKQLAEMFAKVLNKD
jgi:hypothetical protein